jgi:hypothetical protein
MIDLLMPEFLPQPWNNGMVERWLGRGPELVFGIIFLFHIPTKSNFN